MKISKLYTGGGDLGMTSLVGGRRVPKTHPRVEAYGTIDELNAFIGLLASEIDDTEILEWLSFVQSKLFTVGTYLASDAPKTENTAGAKNVSSDNKSPLASDNENSLSDECIQTIEKAIDGIDGRLPKLNAFVLRGGTRPAALAHVCRTVCRRAERAVLRLAETVEIKNNVLVFLNRLSDLLFVIARNESIEKNGEEIFWDNSCK
jgi:cob(I)alamin adenosyltransferase